MRIVLTVLRIESRRVDAWQWLPLVLLIGGIAETQEMLDFCGKHNITADIELIPIQKINEAYDRVVKNDVKYRFVIDMASLKKP